MGETFFSWIVVFLSIVSRLRCRLWVNCGIEATWSEWVRRAFPPPHLLFNNLLHLIANCQAFVFQAFVKETFRMYPNGTEVTIRNIYLLSLKLKGTKMKNKNNFFQLHRPSIKCYKNIFQFILKTFIFWLGVKISGGRYKLVWISDSCRNK